MYFSAIGQTFSCGFSSGDSAGQPGKILMPWSLKAAFATGAWNTFGAFGQGAIDATEAAAPIVESGVRAGVRAGGVVGQIGLELGRIALVSAWATGRFFVSTIYDIAVQATAADPDGDDPGGGSYTGTKEKPPRKQTPKPKPVPRMMSGLQRRDGWHRSDGYSGSGSGRDNGKLYKPSFKQFTL